MLRDARNVAAIALVWGSLALVGYYVVGSVGRGRPGTFFSEFGATLALLFALAGAINVAARAAVGSDRR